MHAYRTRLCIIVAPPLAISEDTGVIIHKKETTESHYYAYVFRDGKLWRYNDARSRTPRKT